MVQQLDRELASNRIGYAVHRPMGAAHAQALALVASEFDERTDLHADTDSLESKIAVDDGDLIWRTGGGRDVLFTIVDVGGTHGARAVVNWSVGWVAVADRTVDPCDAVGTARAILELIRQLEPRRAEREQACRPSSFTS